MCVYVVEEVVYECLWVVCDSHVFRFRIVVDSYLVREGVAAVQHLRRVR